MESFFYRLQGKVVNIGEDLDGIKDWNFFCQNLILCLGVREINSFPTESNLKFLSSIQKVRFFFLGDELGKGINLGSASKERLVVGKQMLSL